MLGRMIASLTDVDPAYNIPEDDLVGEVLIPGLAGADEVRIMSGYFSSHALAQIAPGLSEYLSREGKLCVLASTSLSDEDYEAVKAGNAGAEEKIVERFSAEWLSDSSALAGHTADCLAYLIAHGRLEMRFVLMKEGMYHKKIWLFREDEVWVAVHGSGNSTKRGLLVNGEQMRIERPWTGGDDSEKVVRSYVDDFESYWGNKMRERNGSLTITADNLIDLLRNRRESDSPPTTEDFWAAWQQDFESGLEPVFPPGVHSAPGDSRMRIPDNLEWASPPYGHQARAIEKLEEAGGSGILAIATGGGKTLTALIATTRLQDRSDDPALVLILAPTNPLARQWSKEVVAFGVRPKLLSRAGGIPSERRRQLLAEAAASLQVPRRTEVLIATNTLFNQPGNDVREFAENISSSCKTILIGDEVHNLGAPSFLKNPPDFFQYRIGLSATPVHQYDAERAEDLFRFFSTDGEAVDSVFSFSLSEAIKAGCLVPYNYLIHPVEFNMDEMERYEELTEELRTAGFHFDDEGKAEPNKKVERLLRERRALVEQAESKVDALRQQLLKVGRESVRRTLIYNSAKAVNDPHEGRQIDHVTQMLNDLGIVSHQLTSDETSTGKAQGLLEKFGRGDYSVLTAMKVLDEGIDVPQTDVAYLMASSTVEREWVQRRGRILRRSEGKTCADLHDFVVIPHDPASKEGKALLRAELRRVEEFTRLARNEYDSEGPRAVLRELDV